MILADTGIWIAHFRANDFEMQKLLDAQGIAAHPFVIAELALGSLGDRSRTLSWLERLPKVQVAKLSEVRRMIELHALHSKGIGLTDAHLVASALITPFTQLWTRDKRLRAVALGLGIDAGIG